MVRALARMAHPGDTFTIAAVSLCLSSVCVHVRLEALQALADVVQCGDERAIDAMLPLLNDGCETVRLRAGRSIGVLAVGDEYAFDALCVRCLRSVLQVKRAIVEAFVSMLCCGGLDTVAPLVEQHHWEVRLCALEAFGKAKGFIDERLLRAIMACVDHHKWEVRYAALEALPDLRAAQGKASFRSDVNLVGVVARSLEDPDWRVARAAVDKYGGRSWARRRGRRRHKLFHARTCTHNASMTIEDAGRGVTVVLRAKLRASGKPRRLGGWPGWAALGRAIADAEDFGEGHGSRSQDALLYS